MSRQFLIALVVDCIGVLIGLYFVISDYFRYSTSYGYIGTLTLVFSAWTGLAYYLYHHGHPTIASIMAWIPAVPLIGYGLFALMFILFKPDMR